MNRVREQSHRAAEEHNDELQNRRAKKQKQADLERAHTLGAGLQGIVDRVCRVVRVWHEQAVEESLDSCGVAMAVLVLVPTLVTMVVVVIVVVIVRSSHTPTSLCWR